MMNAAGKHVCRNCGREYDAEDFDKALEREIKRLKDEQAKQYARFEKTGKTEVLEIDKEYNTRKAYIKKLSDMKLVGDPHRFCSERCVDEMRTKVEEEKKRNAERSKKLAAERAKNRHNPLYIVKEKPIAFLLGILLWGVPMFLLWKSFLPLPVMAIVAVFLSYLSNWSCIYKLFKKFDLEYPISNFLWTFAFLYALGSAVEAIGGIFDIPYVIEEMFYSLGRDSAYILMVLLVLVITVANPFLQKTVFKKIPSTIKCKVESAALCAISLFSLFHLLNHWISFPMSAILAVVGTVAAYKKFDSEKLKWIPVAIFFANLVLSETLFV